MRQQMTLVIVDLKSWDGFEDSIVKCKIKDTQMKNMYKGFNIASKTNKSLKQFIQLDF